MDEMTVRVPRQLKERIETDADSHDVSESEAARRLLERGTECDDLQSEYDDLQSEVERLQAQLRSANNRPEVDDRLVRYVEHNIEWHEADIATKARWLVFGRD